MNGSSDEQKRKQLQKEIREKGPDKFKEKWGTPPPPPKPEPKKN